MNNHTLMHIITRLTVRYPNDIDLLALKERLDAEGVTVTDDENAEQIDKEAGSGRKTTEAKQ